MKERILDLLTDPYSKEPLKLIKFETRTDKSKKESEEDIVSGVLVSKAGNVFPIYQGVPRILKGALHLFESFTEKWNEKLKEHNLLNERSLVKPEKEFEEFILPTLKRFEKEWSNHELEDNTWGWSQIERIEKVKEYMGWSADEFKGKLILDAGAGTGQLTSTIAKYLDCEIIGLDLTPAVARGWKEKEKWAGENHLRVHIVQGDINNPPFKDETFDGVHSSGVLHHTPNTKNAFDSIVPLVKENGKLAVWLYKPIKSGLPIIPFVKSDKLTIDTDKLREFTPKINPNILYSSLFVYSSVFHLFYKINEAIRGKKHDQTIKERVTSLFDTYAPPYVFRHTEEEVKDWFEESGFKDIEITDKENEVGFNTSGIRVKSKLK